jgi:hypothetical protein
MTPEQHHQQQVQQQQQQQQATAAYMAAAAAGRFGPSPGGAAGANPYAQYYGYGAGGYPHHYDPYHQHRQVSEWMGEVNGWNRWDGGWDGSKK